MVSCFKDVRPYSGTIISRTFNGKFVSMIARGFGYQGRLPFANRIKKM